MSYAKQAERYLKIYLDDPSEENRAFLSDYGTKLFKAAARAKGYKDSEMEKIAKDELSRIRRFPGTIAGLKGYKELSRSGAKYLFNRKMRCGLFLQMVALGKTLKEGTLESTLARIEGEMNQMLEAAGSMTPEEFILLVKGMLKKEFRAYEGEFEIDLRGDSKYVTLRMSDHEPIDNPSWHPDYDVPVTVKLDVSTDGKNVGVALLGHGAWDDEVVFRAQRLDKRRAQGVVKKARKMWNEYDKKLDQHREDEYEAEREREYAREIADTERAHGRWW